MCYIPEVPRHSYISVPSPSASPTPYGIPERDFAFTSTVFYDTRSTSRKKKTIHYYKRRGWLQGGVSDTRFSVSCRGKKFWYCISKVELLMSYTRFNTMKFSRLRNWIGNNTISIYVSTHAHKTVHNFISTPLVREGWDKWTQEDSGLQTAFDSKIFFPLKSLRERTS